jgi:hypothetical protein
MVDGTVRYRARMGRPRCALERVLQWAWRWRVELALAYIGLAVAASIVLQVAR